MRTRRTRRGNNNNRKKETGHNKRTIIVFIQIIEDIGNVGWQHVRFVEYAKRQARLDATRNALAHHKLLIQCQRLAPAFVRVRLVVGIVRAVEHLESGWIALARGD